jgi:transketolase
VSHLHDPATRFEIGAAIRIREGSDVAFIATGEAVHPALLAAARLEGDGLSSLVISMHTIKPLDTRTLFSAARSCRAMVTVEEHSVFGGLGEACASSLMQEGIAIPLKIIGIPDEGTVSGSQSEVFQHYGISPGGLSEAAKNLLSP